MSRRPREEIITVRHQLDDKHHVFEVVTGEDGVGIQHAWASSTTELDWKEDSGTVRQAIASFLAVPDKTVRVTPHPALNRILPLWVGKWRWTQSRKIYKKLINKQRDAMATTAKERIAGKWTKQHPGVAKQLQRLDWSRVHRMERVSAYQTHNIVKLKLNQLLLWAGVNLGFRCTSNRCQETEEHGVSHLIWMQGSFGRC